MKYLKPLFFCPTFLLFITAGAQEEKPKPRIFITDSQSWEIAGGFAASNGTASGTVRGGARPQTAEIIKTFGEKCEAVTVTLKSEAADYIVMLEREGAKQLYRKDNKYAVFKANGDAIKSGSTRTLGNAVKDACAALVKDWRPKEEK
jgi:hypothetical protein